MCPQDNRLSLVSIAEPECDWLRASAIAAAGCGYRWRGPRSHSVGRRGGRPINRSNGLRTPSPPRFSTCVYGIAVLTSE
jgi:hypothetical protein